MSLTSGFRHMTSVISILRGGNFPQSPDHHAIRPLVDAMAEVIREANSAKKNTSIPPLSWEVYEKAVLIRSRTG